MVTLARPQTRSYLKLPVVFLATQHTSPLESTTSLTSSATTWSAVLFLIYLSSAIISPHQCNHHHSYHPPLLYSSFLPSKLFFLSQIIPWIETCNLRTSWISGLITFFFACGFSFLRATAVPAGTAEARISYGNSVCLSVCLSQPGGIPSPDEIETPDLHHILAQSL